MNMRRILLAAAFTAITPVAFAQMSPGTSQGAYGATGAGSSGTMGNSSGTMGNSSGSMGRTQDTSRSMASSANPSRMSGQPDPENCGTPDEPKACPPMPRRPLQHYPANKE
jgi:hypothetical protein